MRRLFALLLVVTVACGGGTTDEPEQVQEVVTGVIVSIDGNAADIDSFVVDEEGEEREIFIKKNFDYGFELTHLYVHEEEGEPVKVTVEVEEGKLYATAIDDA